jgi:hypothetical protein
MPVAMASQPRYPKISVGIESENPLALVAAVREALRLAHVKRSEISRFSNEAFSTESLNDVKEICEEWVCLEPRGGN